MSEEQLQELLDYNLEYTDSLNSEEIFGGDYTSAVELKYAKKEIERLNNIINELEKYTKWQRKVSSVLNAYGVSVCDRILHRLKDLKGSDKE